MPHLQTQHKISNRVYREIRRAYSLVSLSVNEAIHKFGGWMLFNDDYLAHSGAPS